MTGTRSRVFGPRSARVLVALVMMGAGALGAAPAHAADAGVPRAVIVQAATTEAAARSVAGNEPGHERAVAVVIDGVFFARKVGRTDEPRTVQVGSVDDAGVDEGNAHAATGVG